MYNSISKIFVIFQECLLDIQFPICPDNLGTLTFPRVPRRQAEKKTAAHGFQDICLEREILRVSKREIFIKAKKLVRLPIDKIDFSVVGDIKICDA